MRIYNGTCETHIDYEGHRPQVIAFQWKRIHLGLIKIWLGYEHYHLINHRVTPHTLVIDSNGNTIKGKYLSEIEIKWFWR